MFYLDLHQLPWTVSSMRVGLISTPRAQPLNAGRVSDAQKSRAPVPVPPVAWSIFKWSTVICRTSAFSSLEEPCVHRDRGVFPFLFPVL